MAAPEHWSDAGAPENPGASLMAVARNKALDRLRLRELQQRKHKQIGGRRCSRRHVKPDFVDTPDAARADDIRDGLLRLIFAAYNPVLPKDANPRLR